MEKCRASRGMKDVRVKGLPRAQPSRVGKFPQNTHGVSLSAGLTNSPRRQAPLTGFRVLFIAPSNKCS